MAHSSRPLRSLLRMTPTQLKIFTAPGAERFAVERVVPSHRGKRNEQNQRAGGSNRRRAYIGTVDKLEGNRIKLTKKDSGGSHKGHHHYIDRGLVAGVEGSKVRLSATGAVAVTMEEEKT